MGASTIPDNLRWTVTIDDGLYQQIKTQEAFWKLVSLSRMVNALSFVHVPLKDAIDNSPASLRIRFNAFLFAGALVYEASLRVDELGKDFRQLPEYVTLVAPFRTPEVQRLIQTNLKPMRNGAVFHFGYEDVGATLSELKMHSVSFVDGVGPGVTNMHYSLADTCAMAMFTARGQEALDVLRPVAEILVQQTLSLVIQFLRNAEAFIGTALVGLGWRFVPVGAVPDASK